MPPSIALELRGICAAYGSKTVVDRVSLAVHRGEIVGLLGPNGSGKSTSLAIAAGLHTPCAGSTIVEGIQHSERPLEYSRRIGYVPQESALYDELTATQNLEFFAKLYGLRGYELDARICRALVRAKLSDRASERVRTFSGGMKRRLDLAIALLNDPAVLLLDEPTTALDPASREDLFLELQRLRDDGHAILMTTHHSDEIEHRFDRVAFLESGRLIALGAADELTRTKPRGRNVLFGHMHAALPKFVERRIRARLDRDIELEVTGRRVRLTAWTADDLGRALAIVLGEGAQLDQFRSGHGRIDTSARAA